MLRKKLGIALLCAAVLATGIWKGAGPRHSAVSLAGAGSLGPAAGVAGASAPAGPTAQTDSGAPMTTARPVIVIDAGHGGIDGGASAADGTLEKDLNLAVAQALADVVSQYRADVVMTRTSGDSLAADLSQSIRGQKQEDMGKRKALLEQANVLLGISVHMNSFYEDEKVCGTAVIYSNKRGGGTDVRNQGSLSRTVAEKVRESFERNLPSGRHRLAEAGEDIYLFREAEADLILVECGFLSNPEEAKKLQTAEYQRILAEAVWEGVNEILCLQRREDLRIIDSANSTGVWK